MLIHIRALDPTPTSHAAKQLHMNANHSKLLAAVHRLVFIFSRHCKLRTSRAGSTLAEQGAFFESTIERPRQWALYHPTTKTMNNETPEWHCSRNG